MAVKDIAAKAGFSNLKIISAGGSASHSASSRRVDIIFHGQSLYYENKLPADYYLVDASGSPDQYVD